MNDAIFCDIKSAVKGKIPEHSYRMWVEPLNWREEEDGKLVMLCPNFFSKKRVIDNFAGLIRKEVCNRLGCSCTLSFEVANGRGKSRAPVQAEQQLDLPNINLQTHSGRYLRRDFTFDQFVVGNNNDFAYSASLSLASRSGGFQNALYLLSGTGMGKSHLSQAIGHHILSEYPHEKVYYVTAEDFSNEMVSAFRSNSLEQFKERYRRQCDVLLLEDIHSLSGKKRTQKELANTLDSMFESEKRIIFSSCYLPGEIPKIDDQLRSRLTSGLISKINAPNFRTRIRILRKKAEKTSVDVPEEVIHYLAGELTEDIRQLESGMIGIAAKSSLLGAPIDLDLAKGVVKHIARQKSNITIESIKKLICRHYSISPDDLVSRSRKKCIVRPRQVAIYLSRRYTDQPLQSIGKSFNRYHATALHAIGTVEKEVRENGPMQKQIEYLKKKLEKGDF